MRIQVRLGLRIGLQLILTTGVLLLFSSSLTANPAPPTSVPAQAAASNPLLGHDLRLKRSLTLHEINITLKELLLKLSTDGLILTVDEVCGAQKLQLSLHHKSLVTLMNSLSELMPGHWEALQDHRGYLFLMSQKAVVRRQRWWDLYNEQRKLAKEAQRQKVLETMRNPPPLLHGFDTHGNELFQLEAQMERYRQFFRDLPAELQERIANQMVGFSIELGYGQMQGLEEGAITVPAAGLPASLQTTLKEAYTEFLDKNQASISDLTVRFSNVGSGVLASVFLPAEPSGEERTQMSHITLSVDIAPDAAILPLNLRWLDRVMKRLGDSVPPAWKELAAYQDTRVWPNDKSRYPGDEIHADIATKACRSDFLERLAEQAEMDFVSDYYSGVESALETKEMERPLRYDLKEELDELAQSHDVSWRHTSGDIYLIRNNRWYRDDVLEIPTPLLQRWWKQLVALQRLSAPSAKNSNELFKVRSNDHDPSHLKAQMDWEADVASHLTDLQIATSFTHAVFEQEVPSPSSSPLEGAGLGSESSSTTANHLVTKETVEPFAVVGNTMQGEVNTLRFYAGLDATQKELLLSCRLPMQSLQPAQQDQLLFLLPSLRQANSSQAIWIGLRFRTFPFGWVGEQGAELPDRSIYLVAAPAH